MTSTHCRSARTWSAALRVTGGFLCVVAASAASAAELIVAWAPLSVPVEGYQVERQMAEAGGEYKPIGLVASPGTRFTDRGVTAGVRYCYRIRGVRGQRRSPPSPPLCNVATERPAPGVEAAQVGAEQRLAAKPPTAVESSAPAAVRAPAAAEAAAPTAAGEPRVVAEPSRAPATRGSSQKIAKPSGVETAAVSPAPSRATTPAPTAASEPQVVVEPSRVPATAGSSQSTANAPGVETAATSPARGAATTAAAANSRSGFREVKAISRPPPGYPSYAQLNGISGWVKLMFTVTSDGRTRDIRVVAAEPPGIFDKAAIAAATRFLYSPRLENGAPVDRENVETEITFTWIERGGNLTTERRRRAPR